MGEDEWDDTECRDLFDIYAAKSIVKSANDNRVQRSAYVLVMRVMCKTQLTISKAHNSGGHFQASKSFVKRTQNG
jgi:hypothetical protein